MDNIDLDAIIKKLPRIDTFSNISLVREEVKRGMKEAIHQALILVNDKQMKEANNLALFIRGKIIEGARTNGEIAMYVNHFYESDEYKNQRFPILDIEKLIV